MNDFLGLPAVAPAGAVTTTGEPAAAGRWWIRGCSLGLEGRDALRLRVDGPGWYWVDSDDGDIALHQQVPFELTAELTGSIRTGYVAGVASLWFEPTRDPVVRVEASTDLDVRGASAWGSVLRRVPFLPVRAMTAARLSERASAAFRTRLRDGVTVTYALFEGQADAALGQLAPGQTPRHPFRGSGWIANERLLLPAASTHAFGPIDASSVVLDVRIEQGPGIRYRALCEQDMATYFGAVARGRPERIPARAVISTGALSGAETASTELRVEGCTYYLIVSSAAPSPTVAAVRLRG